MNELLDILDQLREDYRDNIKKQIDGFVRLGEISEEEAAELLNAY